MTTTLLELATRFAGKACDIQATRPLRRKELSAGNKERNILKESLHNVFIGRSYDNHKTVQEARASGVLPSENRGLQGKEWVVYPSVKRSLVNGNLFLTVFPAGSGSKSRIIEDGVELTREQYLDATIASIHNRPPSPQKTFDLTFASIDSITVGGVKWFKTNEDGVFATEDEVPPATAAERDEEAAERDEETP